MTGELVIVSNPCGLCGVTSKRPIGTTGVTYCPHCDALCSLNAPKCPACVLANENTKENPDAQ